MPVVLVEKESPQISVVTLNRPERRNALTLELLTELCAAIRVASEQPEQRILIFRGAGAAFCTGLDLKEAADTTKAHAPVLSETPTWVPLSLVHDQLAADAPGIHFAENASNDRAELFGFIHNHGVATPRRSARNGRKRASQ